MVIKNISTPKELVEELKQVTSQFGYFEVLQRMNITREAFESYFTWSDEKYTRNCIARTDDFELMLGINNNIRQATPEEIAEMEKDPPDYKPKHLTAEQIMEIEKKKMVI